MSASESLRTEFHDDLKDFLKAETADVAAAEEFERMRDKYPSTMREGRVEFFPAYRGGGHLVRPPWSGQESEAAIDVEMGREMADYLMLEDEGKGLKALEKLEEFMDEYDYEWEDGRLLFYSPEYGEAYLDIPGLRSLVMSFNRRYPGPAEDDSQEEIERGFIRDFLDEKYRIGGVVSKTVYQDGDIIAVLDEDPDGPEDVVMEIVDYFPEALPMMELIEGIRFLSEYDNLSAFVDEDDADSGEGEMLRLLGEYYSTGHAIRDSPSDVYEVFHDPLDRLVVLWGGDSSGDEEFMIVEDEVLVDLKPLDTESLYNDILGERQLFDSLL